jgi:hypothetical protein
LQFGNDVNSLCAVGGAVHIVFAGGCVVEVSEALYHKKSRRPNLVPLSLTIKEVKVLDGFVTVVAAPNASSTSVYLELCFVSMFYLSFKEQ